MNRWEAGEMTDAQWIAYVKQRLAETGDDPEQQTQWKDMLRDSREKMAVDRVEDGAQDIMSRIEDGKATYSDLARFYTRERARQKKGSELYDQLSEQIASTNKTIGDNSANGTISRAEYLFKSGQISGGQAAAMIRGAASRYKNSDTAKYYSLMSSAYDIQTYGAGSAGGGGGGGGGGGSSGSSGPSLSSTIDSLEYTADAIDLLNMQFEDGAATGKLPDGTEIVLRDGKNNPVKDWREIDNAMIETLQAQYEAKLENGDRDAVEPLQRIQTYITSNVQPRNTIPRERQFGILNSNLTRGIELADIDPDQGVKAIRDALGAMDRWVNRLNTKTTSTDVQKRASDAKLRENPELAAAVRRSTTTEADDLSRTTDEFAESTRAYLAAAREVFDNPNLTPAQAQSLLASTPLGDLMTEGQATQTLTALSQISTVHNGLKDGSWVKVQLADGSLAAAPMVDSAVTGPDGQKAVTQRRPDLSAFNIDPDRQDDAMVLREIDGKPQLVWAIGNYMQNEANERVLVVADGRGGAFARNEAGGWIGSDGAAAAMPFLGASKSNAQRWANANPELAAGMVRENGGDPATVDMANLFYRSDRLITERENETQRAYLQPSTGASRNPKITGTIEQKPPPGGGNIWGQPTGSGSRYTGPTGAPGSGGGRPTGIWGQPAGALEYNGPNNWTQRVSELGAGMGIKFQVEDHSGVMGARLRGGPRMIDMAPVNRVNVQRPNVRPVSVSRPNINVPDFSALRARIAATTRTSSVSTNQMLQNVRNSGGFV